MKNIMLLLCMFIVLFAACSNDNNEIVDTESQDIQSTKIFSGTWVSDSLRYTGGSEKSGWSKWENTEPDTIIFSTDSAYFGFTDKEEISGSYQYTENKHKIFFDGVELIWKVRPDGKLFLQFSSPKEMDQYLYHQIK